MDRNAIDIFQGCFSFEILLKRRKTFQNILSCVLRGSILGPILFNICLLALILCIKKSDIHNFADDNNLSLNRLKVGSNKSK